MAPRLPRARLSGFYFCYFAILGAFLPYWPLYLQNIGYDPAQIGWLMAILPATKIVSPSVWGWFDRSGRTLPLIRWAGFLALACFGGVFASPGELAALVAVLLTFSFCWNATLPLFETVTLGHLGEQAALYGRIRLWGSVGFILTVWALGAIFDGFMSIARLPEIVVLLLACQWLVSLAVPPSTETHPPESNPALWGILKRGEVIAFFVAAVLLQIAHGPYYAFYSIYLDEHGFSDSTIGELWALGVLAEIVVFQFMHRLMRHVGIRVLFLGSLLLSAVRWLMIAWGAEYLGIMLIAQLMHAATFGVAHAASIHLVHRNFRGPHHGKGQALYSGLSFGLGGALGSLYSGEFWTIWGPAWVFTAAAGFSLLALVIAWPRVGRP